MIDTSEHPLRNLLNLSRIKAFLLFGLSTFELNDKKFLMSIM